MSYAAGAHCIELKLRGIDQLFNTMDPSPFHEKDLDDDAAAFILSWAEEFPRREPVHLIVHLENHADDQDTQQWVEDAVHHYFSYRVRLNALEFKRLMAQGRASLVVGLSFMVTCFLIVELLDVQNLRWFPSFLREGIVIAGWVAMWRPLEIYLYEWWPLVRRGQLLAKLSRMPVTVKRSM